MTPKQTPHPDDSLLARPLGHLTRLLVRAPALITCLAVAAALAAILYSAQFLGFHTKRLDLLNPDSAFNKLWIEYIAEFGDQDDVVIVVESRDRDRIAPVTEPLAQAVAARNQLYHAVLHEVDLSGIHSKALHYAPPGKFTEIENLIDRTLPRMQQRWEAFSLTQRSALLTQQLGGREVSLVSAGQAAEVEAEISRLADDLEAALGLRTPKPKAEFSFDMLSEFSPAAINTDEAEFLHVGDHWLGFVLLRLRDDAQPLTSGGEAIDQLRQLIGEIDQQHDQVTIGVTGLPVLENDEMAASQRDTINASLLSFLGVAVLFVIGFGSWRHPLLTVFTLGLAMSWSFAYVTLAVGHLNILSVSFGVILIGLGIDFGIHYVAHYQAERHRHPRSDIALIKTSRAVGPGIITGGITTAIAFFTAGLTEFTGVAELGVIAGGGIVLCILAALVVLPAVLYWSDGRRAATPVEPLHVADWLMPVDRHPGLTLFHGFLETAAIAIGCFQIRYDHNLLNLQPTNLESVALERKLLNQSDRSVWYAISIASTPEELRQRSEAFLALESVDRVEGIYSLLPTVNTLRSQRIAGIGERLRHLPERPPELPIDPPAVLGEDLAALQLHLRGGDWLTISLRRRLERMRELLRQIPDAQYYQQIASYQQRMAGELLSSLHDLRAIADPNPPTLHDLPEALVTRYVGRNGQHLLKIFAKENIWNMEALETFVNDVKGVDSKATGNPLQTYYASRQMQQSYIHASLYALLAVGIVLMLDFRSIRYSLLALAPVLIGMLQMFGLLGALDIPLNPANLILGIGIDDGVHIAHDFRRQSGRYRISNSTAAAVLLTSLTTMVGFGSMMISGHQGLRSLGRVLTIGVACCLFTSLILLPAFLKLLRPAKGQAE